jgi:hypothetical protein
MSALGDQAEGLRRLFGAPAVTLAVAARETDVIGAYALIKQIAHEEGSGCFRIAVTHARSAEEAQTVFDNLQRVAREYLGVRLEYIGMAAPPPLGAGPVGLGAGPRGAALRDSML